MTDSLSLLREYNINKKQITQSDGQIIFGECSFPKDVKTNYLIWRSRKDPSQAQNDYYTLECLLFLLEFAHSSHSFYTRKASAENIQVVRRPDRAPLLAYLNGKTDNCSGVDISAPLAIPTQVDNVKTEITEVTTSPAAKRRRPMESLELNQESVKEEEEEINGVLKKENEVANTSTIPD